jgi:hypothetical protein
MSSDARDNGASARKLFVLSLLLFVVVKLSTVWLPARIMGVPRLGDDALVYLWWGENSFIGAKSPAVRDVVGLHHLDIYASSDDLFNRDHVTMRVTGAAVSPVLLAIGGLIRAGLDPIFAFAIQESIVALVLAAALGVFLCYYFGYAAASITIFILTFAILPQHGVHRFVPSVFALAIGLILFVLASKERPNLIVVFLVSCLLLVSHQIGLVYFCIAGALRVLNAAMNRRIGKETVCFLIALLIAGVLAVLLFLLIGRIPESTDGRGALSFTNVVGNAVAVAQRWINKPFSLIILALGAVAYARVFHLRSPVTLLLALVGAAIVASFFYDIPGYSGIIAMRLFVVFVVVASGVIASMIVARWDNKRVRLATFICCAGYAAISSAEIYKQTYSFANSRYVLIDFPKLRQTLRSVQTEKPILYTEADYGLLTALLAGGYRYGALPIPMISDTQELKSLVANIKPDVLVLQPPRNLSGYSGLDSPSLAKRFYGYRFGPFRRVEIQSKARFKDFAFVRLDGLDGKDKISISAEHRSDDQASNCATPQIGRMPKADWYRIGNPGCRYTKISLQGVSNSVALTGFSADPPGEQTDWPWGTKVSLSAWPKRGNKPLAVDFSWEALFRDNKIQWLNESLAQAPEFTTDQGGLIFAKIEIK